MNGGLRFPGGFLWGAATAAHQVEGRLDNDWAQFERRPKAIRNGDRSEDGVDHYTRFDADFALARAMGHSAHRFSIEWSRIEPERGRWDMAEVRHYHDVLASLQAHGLEPFVTLHHFTNPRWVADQGGWLADRTIADFARFAAFCGREFRDVVRYWITINEPNIYAWHSYVTGTWPPGRHSPRAAFRVLETLERGHKKAYQALHEAYREAPGADRPNVGYSQNLMSFEAFSSWSPLDMALARWADRMFNRAFLAGLGNALDFIGINYYTRAHFRFPTMVLAAQGAHVNDLGWEIYPEGLYRALRLASEYAALPDGRRIPLYVTENGMDDRSGDRRSDYLVKHLAAVHRAISEGIDVRGYIHWTLMDNFEWAEGYAPRFGLFRIDRNNGLERVATPTVDVFRDIAERNAVSAELLTRFGAS